MLDRLVMATHPEKEWRELSEALDDARTKATVFESKCFLLSKQIRLLNEHRRALRIERDELSDDIDRQAATIQELRAEIARIR